MSTNFRCPICGQPLSKVYGDQIHVDDPAFGVTIFCSNKDCKADEVSGHGANDDKAFSVIKNKHGGAREEVTLTEVRVTDKINPTIPVAISKPALDANGQPIKRGRGRPRKVVMTCNPIAPIIPIKPIIPIIPVIPKNNNSFNLFGKKPEKKKNPFKF
jgi:hypothetical protein